MNCLFFLFLLSFLCSSMSVFSCSFSSPSVTAIFLVVVAVMVIPITMKCVMKYVVKLPMIDCLIFKIVPFSFSGVLKKTLGVFARARACVCVFEQCEMIAKIHILTPYFSHFKNDAELLCACAYTFAD